MKTNLKNVLPVVCWIVSLMPIEAPGMDLSSEECFKPSPMVLKGEALKAYPKIRALNEQECAAVQKLLETLVGRWQGSMDEIDCRGSEQSPGKEINHYSVEAEARLGNEGDLSIRSELYSKVKQTGAQQLHTISLKEKILRWGWDKGFVEPISVSAEKLSFRFKTGAYGAIREMFITIEGDSDMLLIDEEIYTWGKLNSRRHWQLGR